MRQRHIVLSLLFLILLFGGEAYGFDIDGSLAVPGGIVTVYSSSGSELAGGGELRSASGLLSSGEAVPVEGVGGQSFVLLLPVPADYEESEASVLIRNGSGEVVRRNVSLSPREFVSEKIGLNGPMSDLRQSDSLRKAEESRRMWEILSSFDVTAPVSAVPLILPVGKARESSHFGDRRVFLYHDGSDSRSLHYGIDYAVPTGTPVAAAADGKVVLAAERFLTGNSLVIEHGPGIFTIYYHLDSLAVHEGDSVEEGQIVAQSGATGLVTGAHLHWELRVNRVPVDPLLFLERPIVRIGDSPSTGG